MRLLRLNIMFFKSTQTVVLGFLLITISLIMFPNSTYAKHKKPKAKKYKDYSPRKTLFYFGGGVVMLHFRGNDFINKSGNESVYNYRLDTMKANPFLVHFNIGKQITLKTINNNFNIAIEPSLRAGYGAGGVIKSVMMGDFSLYASLRMGAGSTLENEERIGYGIGFGASARGYKMDYQLQKVGGIIPTAYLEMRFRQRDDLWYFRIIADIRPYKYMYDSYTGSIQGPSIRMIGIQVLRD